MRIPAASITVPAGHNPRTHFDDAKLADLRRSLTENGQIQAITVRADPANDGSYLLVSGERRLRAMRELGWTEVNAEVVDVSEADAKLMALEENLVRADIGPAEEARYLRILLDTFDGNRVEVGKRLGWSQSKMASRLGLLQATDDVLDALAAGSVLLGHAELLAAVPGEMQAKALARILDEKLSVAAVRDALSTAALSLDEAIFPKHDCANCPSNSSIQATLFEVNVGSGKCSNRSCYSAKTAEALAVQRAELDERFAVVKLVSEVEQGTSAPVSEAVVGCGQWAGCLSCTRFGALVNDRLGAHCGEITQSVCFNTPCREAKIATREAAERAAAAPPADAASDSDAPSTAPSSGGGGKSKVKAAAASSKGLRPVVQEHFDGVLRRAAGAFADSSEEACLAVMALAVHRLLSEAGLDSPFSSSRTMRLEPKQVAALTTEPAPDVRKKLLSACRTFIAADPGAGDRTGFDRKSFAACLAKTHDLDLRPHVVVDEPLLTSLTLSEISAWLDKSGFRARVLASTDGEKKWSAFSKLNKANTVKAIVDSRFPFEGFIPPGMDQHCAARRKG